LEAVRPVPSGLGPWGWSGEGEAAASGRWVRVRMRPEERTEEKNQAQGPGSTSRRVLEIIDGRPIGSKLFDTFQSTNNEGLVSLAFVDAILFNGFVAAQQRLRRRVRWRAIRLNAFGPRGSPPRLGRACHGVARFAGLVRRVGAWAVCCARPGRGCVPSTKRMPPGVRERPSGRRWLDGTSKMRGERREPDGACRVVHGVDDAVRGRLT
jgi:hypothetical protein